MTRKLIAASLAALVATLGGCASAPPVHYALAPIKSNGQALQGLDARTTLESRQPGGIVSVRASPDFADYGASFIIAVQNKSGGALDFGPKNIEAAVGSKHLAVLGAEELDAKTKGKLKGYIQAATRSGTRDIEEGTPSAQRQYTQETFGGNLAGQGGGASCALDEGCRSFRTDRENRENDAKVVAEAAASLQASQQLLQRALRPAVVQPEQLTGGIVVVEPPKGGGPVDLTITFNGQKHRFTFDARPTA